MQTLWDEVNECLVLDVQDVPPVATCSNCKQWTQTKFHRTTGSGQTGYCWTVNQNRYKSDTCPAHFFVDEF